MPNRITAQMAFDVVSAAADWVREYERTLEVTDFRLIYALQETQLDKEAGKFWLTLKPLYAALLKNFPTCAWWVAALRLRRAASSQVDSRDPFAFYPRARKDVCKEPTWKISSIMSVLSKNSSKEPFETLLTSDLCINVLQDFTPLVIENAPGTEGQRKPWDHWHLDVGDLASEIEDKNKRFTELLMHLPGANYLTYEKILLEVDNSLKQICKEKLIATVKLNGPDDKEGESFRLRKRIFPEHQSHTLLPLAKYVTIMSTIWPRWKRIWMLPHPSPTSDYVQPGGVVICEDDAQGGRISRDEVTDLSNISAAAMWPWLGVSVSDAGAPRDRNLESPLERLRNTRNDFSDYHKEWKALGRALIDTGAPPCRPEKPEEMETIRTEVLRNCAKSVSVIIPVKGNKRLFLDCLRSIERQDFVIHQGAKVELIIIQDGPESNVKESPVSSAAKAIARRLRKKFGVACHFWRLTEHRGRSSARNVGLHHATNDIVFFVDSTMVLAKSFITEHMIRHTRCDNVALLGFKENIKPRVFEKNKKKILSGEKGPRFRMDLKFRHKLKKDEEFIDSHHIPRKEGGPVCYMDELDWLMDMYALDGAGVRNLPSFFQTGLVSVNASLAKDTGGFLLEIEGNWGLEDTFMGAILLCKGTRFIPCPSSTAYMIQHREPKRKKEQLEANRKVMNAFMQKSMMKDYAKARLVDFYEKTIHIVKKVKS